MAQEFIIGLTEHRSFGYVFQAFLIEKKVSFYTINRMVKSHDLPEQELQDHEMELVKLIDQYSDEKLIKKFSRKKEAADFFQQLDHDFFQSHIGPYIDKYMNRVANILMKQKTRLFFKQAKYSNLYDEDLIIVPECFSECIFHFDRNDDGTHYRLKIHHEDEPLKLLHKKLSVVASEPCILHGQNKLFLFEKITAKKLIPFFEKEFIFIPRQLEDKYYQSFVKAAIKDYPVIANGFKIEESKCEKKAILSLEPNLKMEPVFLLKYRYCNKEFLPGNERKVAVNMEKKDGTYLFSKIKREEKWESEMYKKIQKFGLNEKNGNFSQKQLELLDRDDQLYELIQWLNKVQDKLIEVGFEIEQNHFKKKYSTGKQQLDVEVKSNEDWFDIYATVRFGNYEIPFIHLKKYILNGIREFDLPNGETAILPKEWFIGYEDLFPFTQTDGDHFKLKKHHFQLLSKQLKGIDKRFYQRLSEFEKTDEQKISSPTNLQAQLRAYQEEGFSWMYHLNKHQFGGCLADDMGLGKTLQTLALLLKLKRLKAQPTIPEVDDKNQLSLFGNEEKSEKIQAASLIVMPTSLIHNWENEIKKFTPSLSIYKHVGIQRKKSLKLKSIIYHYDLILTTYGTVRNDLEILKKHAFFYLILDESQYIKNPESKTYRAVSGLKACFRLVLTGTPIENSLSDLWAQINFLNKGLVGNLAYFKREFITPIEKKNDPEKQRKLQTLIRPFVLRRTKEEVTKDLPALTEQVRYCEMTDLQKEFYEKEKSIIRNCILQNIEKEGMKKSAFVVLQGLMKLRQLANHPSMLNGNEEAESGKFNEVFRCLENLMAEKHKVLIFSSFVKHLNLLKSKIESQNWKYSLLTGQTINRKKTIQNFQDDPENRIFLISLKAGGVGLNLTSADYVFIIDPWWNPATENQAISRAHRIGQDKKVFVYRFITEGSIEEKIQILQNRKSSLAEKFINSNNPFKAVTQEEIIGLFS